MPAEACSCRANGEGNTLERLRAKPRESYGEGHEIEHRGWVERRKGDKAKVELRHATADARIVKVGCCRASTADSSMADQAARFCGSAIQSNSSNGTFSQDAAREG